MTLLADGFPATARFQPYGPRQIDRIARRYGLPPEITETVRVISAVLPFRGNEYVLDQLVDWHDVPADPIFQLVFPQRGMLPEADELRLAAGPSPALVRGIRVRMNPHPSGQRLNVPAVDGTGIPGLQHKYRETVLYFPAHGRRCVTDDDADDLLRLFEEVVTSGRTLAVMAHFTHPRELETSIPRKALARIRSTGAVVCCQAPVVARLNDAATWARLWRMELAASAVPDYMFVERDTGPYEYFKVPLARAAEIFGTAYRTLPGLARTVRGPVMSTAAGKVIVDGVQQTQEGRFFQLRMAQARNPALTGRPFRAWYSATASWLPRLRLDTTTCPDVVAEIVTGITGAPSE